MMAAIYYNENDDCTDVIREYDEKTTVLEYIYDIPINEVKHIDLKKDESWQKINKGFYGKKERRNRK